MQYCQLLTAELETMSLQGMDIKQQKLAAMQVETSQKGVKGQGKGGKQGSGSPNLLNELGVCRFFASPGGCRYGRSCMHPHGTLSPADNKCFNCGAEGHSMSQCARPTMKASPKTPASPVPKLPAPAKAEAKGIPRPEAKAPNPGSPNPKAAAKTRRNPKGRKLGVTDESGLSTSPDADNAEDVPWEGAIKSVMVPGPHATVAL